MRVADDDAPVAWELLRVVWVLRAESSSVTSLASGSWMASGEPWDYRSARTKSYGRRTSPTTVNELDRLAIGVLLPVC